jgi:hypothetical protein
MIVRTGRDSMHHARWPCSTVQGKDFRCVNERGQRGADIPRIVKAELLLLPVKAQPVR